MKKAAIVMVMVTAIFCLFLAGCGDKDDGKVNDTSANTTEKPADNMTNNTSRATTTEPRTNNTTNTVGEGITDAVSDAGDAVSDVVSGAGDAATDAGRGLEKGVEDIFNR